MVSATEAIVVGDQAGRRNGRSTSVSLARPHRPATRNASAAAGTSGR